MIFKRGVPIYLVERIYTIDPLTGVQTPADPTAVTFNVLDPNGVTTPYASGVSLGVTNPMVGQWVCALNPPLPPGIYSYEVVGSGDVVSNSGPKTFEVLDSDVLPPGQEEVATPTVGTTWISGSDVAALCGAGANEVELDYWAGVSSTLMYELSGRQYPGILSRLVRPCRQSCSCFGMSSSWSTGLNGPWYWGAFWYRGSWAWSNDCGDTCGCGSESRVKLAGYPVREIQEVKINGDVVDPSGYRLDERQYLTRMSFLPNGEGQLEWPACQHLDLNDDQPGTFSVRYNWGTPPPELGKMAAAQLACELFSAATTGECKLPSRVTRLVRQGATMERVIPTSELIRSGSSGLPLVDYFIAQANPAGIRRRPAIFSPDVQQFARRLGQ